MIATERSPHMPLKVLVVEDSRTQAERLRHLLEQHGYEVTVALNGRLALEALPTFRPDLILSDVNMPEMDGYELSRQIKADPNFCEVPVMLVTTMSDPQDVIRGLECGADNFVLKPYDDRYLLGRLRYVLANREIRRSDDAAMGVGIVFNGQRHFITADRLQILNLLLSTYEAAIQRNKELSRSHESLEKRSAEVAMANRFLDSMIENIPHMIFVKNADDLRYVRVNRAVEELVGWSRNEMLGRTDHDFFPAHQADFFVAKDRETLKSDLCTSVDEPIETKNKGIRILRTTKLAIQDEFNRSRFLLGISEDITEKKEREREILRLNAELERRSAEAQQANEAKSTFLATMSHEIRTPMNGMLGMLELLSLTGLDVEQRATLEVVLESSKSLLRIVDDVLDYSKMEAGQLEIRPEVNSIGQILNEVESIFSSAAANKGLALKSRHDPKISPALRLDSLRLRQILSNFVSNSLKFTRHGSIEINVELMERGNGIDEVRFSVIDTGTGISPENQQRLFQPFSQGDAMASRLAGGTGLGLSICRRLATMMGGSVQMTSELGTGTTMMLTLGLPVAEPDELQRPETQAASWRPSVPAGWRAGAPGAELAQAEGAPVLLVDDHPTNRLLLLQQLKILGYRAESAEDGVQALEKWKSGRFEIVITDCEMPERNGYELARTIRTLESSGRKRIPIIACTAHALPGEADKCIAAGMDDCLVKPIDLSRLAKTLEKWLPPRAETAMPASISVTPQAVVGSHPVDLSQLTANWGGLGMTVGQILQSFRRVNDEDTARLRHAVVVKDIFQINQIIHRMLGSSKMIGAHDFVNACERIDRASHAGDWKAVLDCIHEFDQQWTRLNTYIDSIGPVVS